MRNITQSKKIGRPSTYSLEIAKEICETITSTSKGIKKLCRENKHWPSHDTIYRWLNENREFSDLYARAKQNQIEIFIDEIIEISDDVTHDSSMNANGQVITNHENINRSKLRIDSRKWLASKLVPRVYGSKDPKDQKECVECASRIEYANFSDDELLRLAEEIIQEEKTKKVEGVENSE